MRKSFALFFVCVAFLSKAQDVHFTMFHAAPTVLNPATAGVMDGNFRATTNFKNQWGTISNAYNTYAITCDGALFKNNGKKAHLGVAFNAYHDVAGTTRFGTTKANLTLSGIIYSGEYSTLSLGITGGWAQRSISSYNLQWDSQFDGQTYNAYLPSNESFQFENSHYFDFSTGFLWAYGTEASNLASFNKFQAQIGVAYHHLARPELMAYYGTADKLYSRIAFHADMNIAQEYSKLAVRPRIYAFLQGPSYEINIGTMFRYLIQDGSKYTGNAKGFAISGGAYYRFMDAISPSIEIEWGGFTLGYCYDFNISKLRSASSGFGGSEVYLKFQNPNPFFRFSRTPSIR